MIGFAYKGRAKCSDTSCNNSIMVEIPPFGWLNFEIPTYMM